MRTKENIQRREFIKKSILGAGVVAMAGSGMALQEPGTGPQVHCQEFTWITYFDREDEKWFENLNDKLLRLPKPALTGMEVLIEMEQGFPRGTLKRIGRADLAASSAFVNPTLHIENQVQDQIQGVLAIVRKFQSIGTKVIVVNPEAIEEDASNQKSDKELKVQARALDQLGQLLRHMGCRMLYHNHAIEMENEGKEFFAMVENTKPENMGLCIDADWINKGLNSLSGLYDIVSNYAGRIEELHLRQTVNDVWAETFGEGDIDYSKIMETLKAHKQVPRLVLEQAVDDESPHQMDPIDAIGKSITNVREIFAPFGNI